jgi:hypothetical protein
MVKHRFNRTGREARLLSDLPSNLRDGLCMLVSREKARFLWSSCHLIKPCPHVLASLAYLQCCLALSPGPSEVPLGQIIPCKPLVHSRSDASQREGGGHSLELWFWFDVKWSPEAVRGLRSTRLGTPGCVHINALEVIVLLLQLATAHVRLDTMSSSN